MTKTRVISSEADLPRHFDSPAAEAEFWETHEFAPEFICAHRIPRERLPLARLRVTHVESLENPPEGVGEHRNG